MNAIRVGLQQTSWTTISDPGVMTAPTIQNAKVQGAALKTEIRRVQDAIAKVRQELTSPKAP